uniref:Ig-like domain-containing protein n=1 Tax=Cyanoderma ruficeps TaxID=181631 RepID=A0A8C3P5Y3_9PASS
PARLLRSPSAGLWAQLRLQEAGGGLRAAGDSVTLSCRGSNSTFEGYVFRWYRQAPGGSLEWLSIINLLRNVKKYGAAVEGRATVSRDSHQLQSSLFLWALHPNDSARYFCTIHTETGNPAEL